MFQSTFYLISFPLTKTLILYLPFHVLASYQQLFPCPFLLSIFLSFCLLSASLFIPLAALFFFPFCLPPILFLPSFQTAYSFSLLVSSSLLIFFLPFSFHLFHSLSISSLPSLSHLSSPCLLFSSLPILFSLLFIFLPPVCLPLIPCFTLHLPSNLSFSSLPSFPRLFL